MVGDSQGFTEAGSQRDARSHLSGLQAGETRTALDAILRQALPLAHNVDMA